MQFNDIYAYIIIMSLRIYYSSRRFNNTFKTKKYVTFMIKQFVVKLKWSIQFWNKYVDIRFLTRFF